jgi:hypothetical protein
VQCFECEGSGDCGLIGNPRGLKSGLRRLEVFDISRLWMALPAGIASSISIPFFPADGTPRSSEGRLRASQLGVRLRASDQKMFKKPYGTVKSTLCLNGGHLMSLKIVPAQGRGPDQLMLTFLHRPQLWVKRAFAGRRSLDLKSLSLTRQSGKRGGH